MSLIQSELRAIGLRARECAVDPAYHETGYDHLHAVEAAAKALSTLAAFGGYVPQADAALEDMSRMLADYGGDVAGYYRAMSEMADMDAGVDPVDRRAA